MLFIIKYDIIIYEKNTKRGGLVVNIQDIKDVLGLIISLSSVLGIFTGIVNKLFSNKLKPIYARFDKDEEQLLKQRMNSARFRVVQFAGELRRGVEHTHYEYESIFTYMDDYEECVTKLKMENNYFTEESRYIRERYRELMNRK